MKIELYHHDKPTEKIAVYKMIEILPDTIIVNHSNKQYFRKLLTNNI